MSFNIQCPYCNTVLEVDEQWVGMECECPQCRQKFVVPAPLPTPGVRPQPKMPPSADGEKSAGVNNAEDAGSKIILPSGKSIAAAMILSIIIPGLGQIYLGQKNKGWVLLGLNFLLLFLLPSSDFLIVIPISYSIIVVLDAFTIGLKLKSGQHVGKWEFFVSEMRSAMQPSKTILPNGQSSAVSMILSMIFPGLGQIYLGQKTKGVVLMIAYLFLIFIIVQLANHNLSFTKWFGLLVIIYGTVVILDALVIGQKLEAGQCVREWEFY